MKTSKLVAAVVAASVCFSSAMTVPASAGFYKPYHSKYVKHYKHVKHKHVGGHHSGSGAVWWIIGCAGGVVLAALAANARDHRELTANEAASCGLLFLFSPPNNPL